MTFLCCVYFGRGADAYFAFRDVSYPWTVDEFNVFYAHGEATSVGHIYALCQAFYGRKQPGEETGTPFNTVVKEIRGQICRSRGAGQALSDDVVAISFRIDILRANSMDTRAPAKSELINPYCNPRLTTRQVLGLALSTSQTKLECVEAPTVEGDDEAVTPSPRDPGTALSKYQDATSAVPAGAKTNKGNAAWDDADKSSFKGEGKRGVMTDNCPDGYYAERLGIVPTCLHLLNNRCDRRSQRNFRCVDCDTPVDCWAFKLCNICVDKPSIDNHGWVSERPAVLLLFLLFAHLNNPNFVLPAVFGSRGRRTANCATRGRLLNSDTATIFAARPCV
jgi:hypothetical protein